MSNGDQNNYYNFNTFREASSGINALITQNSNTEQESESGAVCQSSGPTWDSILQRLGQAHAQLADQEKLQAQLEKYLEKNPGDTSKQLGACQSNQTFSEGTICRFSCQENYKLVGEANGLKVTRCVCHHTETGSTCNWNVSPDEFMICGNRTDYPDLFEQEAIREMKKQMHEERKLEKMQLKEEKWEKTLGYLRVKNGEVVPKMAPLPSSLRKYPLDYAVPESQNQNLTTNSTDIPEGDNPYKFEFSSLDVADPIKIGVGFFRMNSPIQYLEEYVDIVAGNQAARIEASDVFLFQGSKLDRSLPEMEGDRQMFFFRIKDRGLG